MKILGVDFGSKRVGIAVADTEAGMAFPKAVLENSPKFFEEFKKICEVEKVSFVVLGESKDFNMDDNKIMEAIHAFKKQVEDFVCGNCGVAVKGNGFTNHCPKCLWGKHVDIHPGDRAEVCKGAMEPVAIESRRDGDMVVHRCIVCGKISKNHLSKNDDFDTVLQISKKVADNFAKDVISL